MWKHADLRLVFTVRFEYLMNNNEWELKRVFTVRFHYLMSNNEWAIIVK